MVAHQRPTALGCSVLGCAVFLLGCEPGPQVPLPAPLAEELRIDPGVAAAVEEARVLCAQQPEDAERRLRYAMTLDANGLTERASEAYRATLQLAPDHAQAWYLLAHSHLELGASQAALEAFDQALERRAAYAPAHWSRGRVLLDEDRLDEAEEAFRNAVRLSPEEPGGPVGLARIELQRSNPAEARAILERYLERKPGESTALRLLGRVLARLGDEDGAREATQRAERRGRPSETDPWAFAVDGFRAGYAADLNRANEAFRAGRPDEALALLKPLFERRPADATVFDLYLRVLTTQGLWQDAQQAIERAEQGGAAAHRVALNRGLLFGRQGRFDVAIQALREAVDGAPDDAYILACLGEALVSAERFSDASPVLERALGLGTPNVKLYLLQGRTLSGLERTEEALQIYRTAAERFPREPGPWARQAELLIELEREDDARAALQGLAQRRANHPLLARHPELLRNG